MSDHDWLKDEDWYPTDDYDGYCSDDDFLIDPLGLFNELHEPGQQWRLLIEETYPEESPPLIFTSFNEASKWAKLHESNVFTSLPYGTGYVDKEQLNRVTTECELVDGQGSLPKGFIELCLLDSSSDEGRFKYDLLSAFDTLLQTCTSEEVLKIYFSCILDYLRQTVESRRSRRLPALVDCLSTTFLDEIGEFLSTGKHRRLYVQFGPGNVPWWVNTSLSINNNLSEYSVERLPNKGLDRDHLLSRLFQKKPVQTETELNSRIAFTIVACGYYLLKKHVEGDPSGIYDALKVDTELLPAKWINRLTLIRYLLDRNITFLEYIAGAR